MRTTTVMGYLGAKPEVKTTKNGNNFTSLRLANHEYNDGENVTYWYTVTIWDASMQKFCEKLKKGSSVIVTGDYSNRVYTNKLGQTEIGNDIRATAIYFTPSSRNEDDENASTPAATTSTPTAVKATVKTELKPTVVQPEVNMDADGDDLPF